MHINFYRTEFPSKSSKWRQNAKGKWMSKKWTKSLKTDVAQAFSHLILMAIITVLTLGYHPKAYSDTEANPIVRPTNPRSAGATERTGVNPNAQTPGTIVDKVAQRIQFWSEKPKNNDQSLAADIDIVFSKPQERARSFLDRVAALREFGTDEGTSSFGAAGITVMYTGSDSPYESNAGQLQADREAGDSELSTRGQSSRAQHRAAKMKNVLKGVSGRWPRHFGELRQRLSTLSEKTLEELMPSSLQPNVGIVENSAFVALRFFGNFFIFSCSKYPGGIAAVVGNLATTPLAFITSNPAMLGFGGAGASALIQMFPGFFNQLLRVRDFRDWFIRQLDKAYYGIRGLPSQTQVGESSNSNEISAERISAEPVYQLIRGSTSLGLDIGEGLGRFFAIEVPFVLVLLSLQVLRGLGGFETPPEVITNVFSNAFGVLFTYTLVAAAAQNTLVQSPIDNITPAFEDRLMNEGKVSRIAVGRIVRTMMLMNSLLCHILLSMAYLHSGDPSISGQGLTSSDLAKMAMFAIGVTAFSIYSKMKIRDAPETLVIKQSWNVLVARLQLYTWGVNRRLANMMKDAPSHVRASLNAITSGLFPPSDIQEQEIISFAQSFGVHVGSIEDREMGRAQAKLDVESSEAEVVEAMSILANNIRLEGLSAAAPREGGSPLPVIPPGTTSGHRAASGQNACDGLL